MAHIIISLGTGIPVFFALGKEYVRSRQNLLSEDEKNALIIDVKGENEMMKKTYIEPEIEIVCFVVNDVVTASGNGEWDSKEMIGGDLDW